MRGGFNEFDGALLGLPSVTDCDCAVCGRPATNLHHVIEKGVGGVKGSEKSIPLVRLCGSGTTGCHGKVHSRLIHLYWDESKGGWVYCITQKPMRDFDCWERFKDEYKPLPGWVEQEKGKKWK